MPGSNTNKHGLSRSIPADIKREVRRRSKFGCVKCRVGLYEYHHIDPPFHNARAHDAENICCLCPTCHAAVTKGAFSTELILNAYQQVSSSEKADPPVGPLDFHDGRSELKIGGLHYGPQVRTILRYHGIDLMQVFPGAGGHHGRISAVFTDDDGNESLRLIENEWQGSLHSWDISVVSRRITVRKRRGVISLQLRLEPPGKIVIERLDMRFRDAHVLATEQIYAVGRRIGNSEEVTWLSAELSLLRDNPPDLVAIDFFPPQEGPRPVMTGPRAGFVHPGLGVAIGGQANSVFFMGAATEQRSLEEMRKVIVRNPGGLRAFIGSGRR